MLHLAEWLVRLLIPFLLVGAGLLGTVFLYLLVQRAARALIEQHTRRRIMDGRPAARPLVAAR
jgi:hypothetical protein